MRRHLALYLVPLSFVVSVTTKARANDESFTTIDFPGATLTAAYGINPRGDIVGRYIDAGGMTHGFLRSSEDEDDGQNNDCQPDDGG